MHARPSDPSPAAAASVPFSAAPSAPHSPTDTHCPYCALQCGMTLRPADGAGPDAGLLEVAERPAFPVNRGALCGKGRSAAALLAPGARLTGPLIRRPGSGGSGSGGSGSGGSGSRSRSGSGSGSGELEPAGWDEALDLVAARLARTRAEHGPDAVGVFGGGGLTNEKAYAMGKFARVVLGTSQIDYNGRFCMSSAAAASTRAFGLDRGLPFPLADVARTEVLVLVGSNLAETMPPALRHLTELREAGGTLIVVDPRRTRTAEQADLHLAPRPGTDLALALGLLHLLVADGRQDDAYIASRTTGWPEARAAAMAHWPEHVERVTGVPLPQLRRAARLFGQAERAMVLTARGTEQQSKGTDTVGAWINLCLATGRPGRPYSGFGTLTGQGNGQGGREHGQKADQLPGYRRLDDPVARAHVAGVWGVAPESLPGPGRSAYELLDALGDDIRTLLLAGSNPVISAPRAAHVEQRLRKLDFLAVCDVVLSESARLADVVLPVAQWAEETGTTTNLEGRVLLRRKAAEPPPGVRTDLEVLAGLAARLGWERGFPTDPEEVFDELRRASAGGPADYSGIDYGRIAAEDGVFWPCPGTTERAGPETAVQAGPGSGEHAAEQAPEQAPERAAAEGEPSPHPGTPRLFLDGFPTPDGRARFVPVQHRPSAEEPDAAYPLLLTTGRVLAQYQSGAQTRRVGELNAAAPGPFVELHPQLAHRLGAADGDRLAVVSRRGRAVAPARITRGIRPDTVFMPFHWGGEGRANTVTNPALDPDSRMPEFKVCAVRVERDAE